jgi:hypothetical protein
MKMNNDQEFVIARLKEEVFNITEQDIWEQFNSNTQDRHSKAKARTDFLGTHRLIANTILVNFNFTRQSFAIQSRSDESFTHFYRSAALHFNEIALFNNICHFLFLLFPFVGFFLQVVDLLDQVIQTMAIR